MAVCENCGKKPMFGNTRSFSMRHSRRQFKPNIQRVHVMENGNTSEVPVRQVHQDTRKSLVSSSTDSITLECRFRPAFLFPAPGAAPRIAALHRLCWSLKMALPTTSIVRARLDHLPDCFGIDPAIDRDVDCRAPIMSRSARIFGSVSGRNSCPPKPGLTVMTSTASSRGRISLRNEAGVCGLIATPA